MYFISHRGNIDGPNQEKENHPEYIDLAIGRGFDVMIDVWYRNGEFYLGHQEWNCYKITLDYLTSSCRKNYIWCFAKTLQTYNILVVNGIHCFLSDLNRIASPNYRGDLTTRNFIWTYITSHPHRKQKISKDSVIVLPELSKHKISLSRNVIGICSDYILQWRILN